MTELRKIQKERDLEATNIPDLISKDSYENIKDVVRQCRTLGYTWGDIAFQLFLLLNDAMYDIEQEEIVEECTPDKDDEEETND